MSIVEIRHGRIFNITLRYVPASYVSVLCNPILDSMAFLGGSVTANMGWYVISILHDQPSCNIEYYMDGRIDIMGQICFGVRSDLCIFIFVSILHDWRFM